MIYNLNTKLNITIISSFYTDIPRLLSVLPPPPPRPFHPHRHPNTHTHTHTHSTHTGPLPLRGMVVFLSVQGGRCKMFHNGRFKYTNDHIYRRSMKKESELHLYKGGKLSLVSVVNTRVIYVAIRCDWHKSVEWNEILHMLIL